MNIFWLLVAVSGHGGPTTLATFNNQADCMAAARSLDVQAKDRTGSPYTFSFCIPVKADSLEKK